MGQFLTSPSRPATLRRRLTENSRNQFDNIIARAPLRLPMTMAAETIKLHVHIHTHTHVRDIRACGREQRVALAKLLGQPRRRHRNRFPPSVFEAASEQRCRADAKKWEKSLFYVPLGPLNSHDPNRNIVFKINQVIFNTNLSSCR